MCSRCVSVCVHRIRKIEIHAFNKRMYSRRITVCVDNFKICKTRCAGTCIFEDHVFSRPQQQHITIPHQKNLEINRNLEMHRFADSHVCIHMYTYTCVYTNVCTHMYVHTHVSIHVFVHPYICTHMDVQTYMNTRVCTHMYVRTCMYTHVCTHMYVHTYMHTHMGVYLKCMMRARKLMVQCVAVCCRVLQCVVVCCRQNLQ